MNHKLRPAELLLLSICCSLLLFALGGLWGSIKAKAFFQVTGRKIGPWEALVLDLRIQEPVKPGANDGP